MSTVPAVSVAVPTTNGGNQEEDRPPFQITYAPKPMGTPGRKPPRGYNLQEILRQADEFEIFRPDGYWPLRAFVYGSLKSSSEKFKRLRKTLALSGSNTTPSNSTVADGLGNEPDAEPAQPLAVQVEVEVEAEVEVEVETATDYAVAINNVSDDDDTEQLVNELSSMSIDPGVNPGNISMHDDSLDDQPAPGPFFLQEMTASTAGSVTAASTQTLQLQGVLQSLAQLSNAERMQLLIGMQNMIAPSGSLSPISFTPIHSAALAHPSLLPSVPVTALAVSIPVSVHAPTPASVAVSTLASAGATRVTIPTHAVHTRAVSSVPAPPLISAPADTLQLNPKRRVNAVPVLANQPPTRVLLLSSVSPPIQPFDDDGTLSDAPSATLSNQPVLSDDENRPSRATKTTARNTRSATGTTRGREGSRGTGRGTPLGTESEHTVSEPVKGVGRGKKGTGGRGASASASTRGGRGRGRGRSQGNGNAPPEHIEESQEASMVRATGARRTRKS
ncbi:hypothetical protein RSOL_460450, partial [Rhizoctonia solani AG-3 Rhs1AP]